MGKSVIVTKVGNELANALAIRRELEDRDDPQLILDMIEGGTDLHEALCVLYEEIAVDEALIVGLEKKIDELDDRKARLAKSCEDRRNLILMAMERAGIQTIKSPVATLTVKQIPPRVDIVNEAEIPSRFWVVPEPKLDKKALNAAVKEGEQVPGAILTNGGITLQIRGG